ncbi:hypothetical protein [Enterococcus mundtii]|uniref:hypothetical protein n=1 Tax=Enterococcus mundtii TaxID=53346 RepID=UPI001157CD82|nr:hypothetical protein [Enterococcus mundtii]
MLKFLKSVLGYSLSYGILLIVFGSIFFALLSATRSLFNSFIQILPNDNSLFFLILDFDYRNFLLSFFISFFLSFIIFLVSITILIFSRNKLGEKNFMSLNIGLYNIVTAIFFTLILVLWLDEQGFMIATSIISFLALLLPLTKRIWKYQFQENQFELSKQKE